MREPRRPLSGTSGRNERQARERRLAAASRGRRAEDVVAGWLDERGWEILATNLRVGHYEIDIVARKDDLVAVVEVRNRGANAWQGGFESVTRAKAARVRRAGERLWRTKFARDTTINRMRFDVATVSFGPEAEPVVEYAEAAF